MYDKEITSQDIDKILKLYAKSKELVGADPLDGRLQEFTHELLQTLFETGFLMVFNWHEWLDRNEAFKDLNKDIHEEINFADLETLSKLMTSYVRGDRFNEGLLEHIVADGKLQCILERLREIKEQLEADK
ncbi:DUF6508 domain-containing protein [Paenibacillus naphthalenovorans]|uniref:Uncharacterized protein n=1 Tax=Paenibacillus naphthalenovorans TaxID=162209 RepID=A0A0U2USI0_9BACL|nr:DUF6508 domain-containing protein [Paenibacillus naphthalenovorans]ALS24945.1 hypothetical protein IJ22_46830 [Paenibacillus naphthalenovorans]